MKAQMRNKMPNDKYTRGWKSGWIEGVESVLQFLEEMEGLDIKKKYNQWANADEYTKLNGEVVKRFE